MSKLIRYDKRLDYCDTLWSLDYCNIYIVVQRYIPRLIPSFPTNSLQAKTYELRKQSKAQLESQLADLKQELSKLRAQNAGSSSVKPYKIGQVRKSIAQILTVINLTQRDQLREFYKGKKYIPKDLRAKKTRAIRRQLTSNEAQKKTVRARKQEIAFPQRKFALKA